MTRSPIVQCARRRSRHAGGVGGGSSGGFRFGNRPILLGDHSQRETYATFAIDALNGGDVLLDGPLPEEKNVWLGRSYADAPEIDTTVFVTGKGLKAGQFVPCEIVASQEYDLAAVPVGKAR